MSYLALILVVWVLQNVICIENKNTFLYIKRSRVEYMHSLPDAEEQLNRLLRSRIRALLYLAGGGPLESAAGAISFWNTLYESQNEHT